MSERPASPGSESARTDPPIISVDGLVKAYGSDTVLDGVSFEVFPGELVVLTGPSGAGKSTLVHLLGALESPDAGTIRIDGIDLGHHGRTSLSHFRRDHVGIVFQLHNLIPRLTAGQNVELAMFSTRRSSTEREARARGVLTRLELGAKVGRRPPQLSGGERARVALARGLANEPPVLLADEPTGNLDDVSAELVASQLRSLADDGHVAVFAVSHDQRLNAKAHRILRLEQGQIFEESGS